jgi:hypothetical protein
MLIQSWRSITTIPDKLGALPRWNGWAKAKRAPFWRTSRWTAVNAHERPESYRAERNAYIRSEQVGISDVAGFSVSMLCAYDDENLVIANARRFAR